MRLSSVTFAAAMAFSTLGHYSVFAAPVTVRTLILCFDELRGPEANIFFRTQNDVLARDVAGRDAAHLNFRADSTDTRSLEPRGLEFESALVTRGGRRETPAERNARMRRIAERNDDKEDVNEAQVSKGRRSRS